MRSKRVQVKCDWCGNEFKRSPSLVGRSNTHFCTHKCYGEWLCGRFTGRDSAQWKGGKVRVKCDYCGKEFLARRHVARRNHHCCSKKCKGKWQTKNLRGEKHPLWNRIAIICEECGSKFLVKPSEIGVRRFCSRQCKGKWQTKNWKGENNPNYGGHLSKQTKRKISEANAGKFLSEEHKRKISKAIMGKNNPFYGKHHSDEFKQRKSKEHRKWMREHGPVFPKPYYVEELGHSVRSKWEEEIGLLLKANGIPYGYETKTFKLNDGTSYTPDFIAGNNVIEVKGLLYDRQKKKYREFNELYPELKFIMVGNGSEEICDIHILWGEREQLIGVLS